MGMNPGRSNLYEGLLSRGEWGMNIYGPFSHCPIVPGPPAVKYNHGAEQGWECRCRRVTCTCPCPCPPPPPPPHWYPPPPRWHPPRQGWECRSSGSTWSPAHVQLSGHLRLCSSLLIFSDYIHIIGWWARTKHLTMWLPWHFSEIQFDDVNWNVSKDTQMHVSHVEQIERGSLACMEACILSPDQKKKERSLKTSTQITPSRQTDRHAWCFSSSPFYLLDLGYCQEISIFPLLIRAFCCSIICSATRLILNIWNIGI